MSHGDDIRRAPAGFRVTGSTETNPIAAIEDTARQLYGVLFHPEVVHTEEGTKVLANFLDVCGCRARLERALVRRRGDDARARAGRPNGRVICALSGGVDSAVAALLIQRAIGERLTCVFVDNGLLRKDEALQVRKRFAERLHLKVVFVDAARRFLRKLEGVTDPERKRKIIGREFIEVFSASKRKTGQGGLPGAGHALPGRDRVGLGARPVGGDQEPPQRGRPAEVHEVQADRAAALLFKDEVRKAGLELGLDEEFVYRQPFPGPGLAVRCLGEVTQDQLALLREADAIVVEEIKAAALYRKLWQSFAVLLPVRAVGVMGDDRTYQYTIALRAVESLDGMTADWVRLPYELAGARSRTGS